jgi:hypothetical protein
LRTPSKREEKLREVKRGEDEMKVKKSEERGRDGKI